MIDCNCKALCTLTSIKGERKHEQLDDGLWCGVLTPNGVFHPKDLLEPTPEAAAAETARLAACAVVAEAEATKMGKRESAREALRTLRGKCKQGSALSAKDERDAIAAMLEILGDE